MQNNFPLIRRVFFQNDQLNRAKSLYLFGEHFSVRWSKLQENISYKLRMCNKYAMNFITKFNLNDALYDPEYIDKVCIWSIFIPSSL